MPARRNSVVRGGKDYESSMPISAPSRVDQLPATLLRADLDLKGGIALEPRIILETLLDRPGVAAERLRRPAEISYTNRTNVYDVSDAGSFIFLLRWLGAIA